MLEANFVEPAHDKQGFERTTVLARLENKLVQMQKTYWFVVLLSRLADFLDILFWTSLIIHVPCTGAIFVTR